MSLVDWSGLLTSGPDWQAECERLYLQHGDGVHRHCFVESEGRALIAALEAAYGELAELKRKTLDWPSEAA